MALVEKVVISLSARVNELNGECTNLNFFHLATFIYIHNDKKTILYNGILDHKSKDITLYIQYNPLNILKFILNIDDIIFNIIYNYKDINDSYLSENRYIDISYISCYRNDYFVKLESEDKIYNFYTMNL
jgi:hypothetical protein